MSLYEELVNGREQMAVVGLGFVGITIAVSFAKKLKVIGYDYNENKISLYEKGIDPTHEVGDNAIKATNIKFTSSEKDLSVAKFFIVAVPTPVNQYNEPDLKAVRNASKAVGRNIKEGSIVVYESTVYPGVTEDVCIPILEEESGLRCGQEFKVGYSPERINPGDKIHRLDNIIKIVSGMDKESLYEIKKIYELIIGAGTFPVSTIKTAEAIKVVENCQRDINIAFMNELSMTFNCIDIDTYEVLEGMNTKWNALGFRPGLVGGHCIGIDPYYFIYGAKKYGKHSQIILEGRRVNDEMGRFIADAAIKEIILAGKEVINARVVILGLTYKENCPDTRNTKVGSIIKRFEEYGVKPIVVDPFVSAEDVRMEFGIELKSLEDIRCVDCIIVAVVHEEFRKLSLDELDEMFDQNNFQGKILIDVKGLFKKKEADKKGYHYWRL